MSLKILSASPEITPLAKSGGLGDVTGSLGPVLNDMGLETRMIMPFYKQVRSSGFSIEPLHMGRQVTIAGNTYQFGLYQCEVKGCLVYLVEHNDFFERDGLYGDVYEPYSDNLLRFSFFCQAVIESAKALDYAADIVHVHDWQTALLPALLKYKVLAPSPLDNAATALTIHNLAYQGDFSRDGFGLTCLPPSLNQMEGLEFWGGISLLKAGIVAADAVTTVSPNYAKEILTPEGGQGMDGILRKYSYRLHGILNGVDYNVWSPDTDQYLPANYGPEKLAGKKKCRESLLASLDLEPAGGEVTVLSMVSRLTGQKGLDLVAQALPRMLKEPTRIIILGSGEPYYENMLKEAVAAHPGRLGAYIGFSEELAHLVQAGSDLLLMPSLFEPCGLSQLYAMRYGTIPIVRAVGGLLDTVKPYNPDDKTGWGFSFNAYNAEAFLGAFYHALQMKSLPKHWQRIMKTAMDQDFSWQASALQYARLFRNLVHDKKRATQFRTVEDEFLRL